MTAYMADEYMFPASCSDVQTPSDQTYCAGWPVLEWRREQCALKQDFDDEECIAAVCVTDPTYSLSCPQCKLVYVLEEHWEMWYYYPCPSLPPE